MGLIPEAVRAVPYGAQCQCGCGSGIGARTACDLLLPAACSNWGCYAAVAALAVQMRNPELLHTPAQEELLLRTGAAAGLLNSPRGTVDPNADNIPLAVNAFSTRVGLGFGVSLLSIGSGMIIGLRISTSMLIGGITGWVIAPPWLLSRGLIAADAPRVDILLLIMWPAVGVLVAPANATAVGLTSIAVAAC